MRSCKTKVWRRSAQAPPYIHPNVYPLGRVYFVLMHETVYPELSGTRHFLENSADHHCIIILHHQDTVVIQTQEKSTENSKSHMPLFGEFGRSSRDLCHYGGYNAMNVGTIG